MIRINKACCPEQLREYAKTAPLNIKDPFDNPTVKRIVRESLLKEQHYLCAYCMTPIGVNIPVIEHILPKDANPLLARDYFNLLCTCSYNDQRPGSEEQHCDLFKGDQGLKILRTLIFSTIEEKITYSNDGTLYSSTPDLLYDINKILNLNNVPYLKRNRLQASQIVDQFVLKMTKKHFCKERIKQRLTSFMSAKVQEEKYLPYFGVIKQRCNYYIKKL